MNDLMIEATQSTPSILACAGDGLLEMRGDSFPENSLSFFTPLLNWVDQYLVDAEKPLRVELYLLYLNTSSVKALMDIFDMLEEAFQRGREVSVNWYYDRDNERIAELAEEFKEDCAFPFGIIGLDA